MGVNFAMDLELVRDGNGFKFIAHTVFGRDFLANYKDTYENAEMALQLLSKALKQKCRVVINIPIV